MSRVTNDRDEPFASDVYRVVTVRPFTKWKVRDEEDGISGSLSLDPYQGGAMLF